MKFTLASFYQWSNRQMGPLSFNQLCGNKSQHYKSLLLVNGLAKYHLWLCKKFSVLLRVPGEHPPQTSIYVPNAWYFYCHQVLEPDVNVWYNKITTNEEEPVVFCFLCELVWKCVAIREPKLPISPPPLNQRTIHHRPHLQFRFLTDFYVTYSRASL